MVSFLIAQGLHTFCVSVRLAFRGVLGCRLPMLHAPQFQRTALLVSTAGAPAKLQLKADLVLLLH